MDRFAIGMLRAFAWIYLGLGLIAVALALFAALFGLAAGAGASNDLGGILGGGLLSLLGLAALGPALIGLIVVLFVWALLIVLASIAESLLHIRSNTAGRYYQ